MTLATILAITDFILNHWQQLAVVGGALLMLLKGKVDKAIWLAALAAVREVAVEELPNAEKRKLAVEKVYKQLPLSVKKFAKLEDVELAVEQAWQLVVQPEIKHQNDPQTK